MWFRVASYIFVLFRSPRATSSGSVADDMLDEYMSERAQRGAVIEQDVIIEDE